MKKILIINSSYYSNISKHLILNAKKKLIKEKFKIEILQVPGVFEIPIAIRKNVKNGLAIVAIERGASGGSYFSIPPQIQMEIASRQKIITDEHSGRILVDAELAQEEQEKMQALFTS